MNAAPTMALQYHNAARSSPSRPSVHRHLPLSAIPSGPAREDDVPQRARGGVSRRAILLTLGSFALLGGVGGVAWFTRLHPHGPSALQMASTATAGAVSPPMGRYLGNGTTPSATPVPILTTLLIYNGHSDIVRTVAWSPDGNNIVSGSRDGTAQLWNAISGQSILNYKQHSDIVSSVTWSSDAKYIASGSFDENVKVWDTKGNTVSTFNPQNKIVSSVSWSPIASRLALTCLDSDEVDLADLNSGIANIFHHIHSNYTYAVALSPDGAKIATASGGGTGATVQVWNVPHSSLIASFNGHVGAVFSVTWSTDGNFIASAGNDKTVRIWDINLQKEVLTYQDHMDAVNTVAWCPTNPSILASGSNDKTVRIWTSFGITLHTYDKHLDSVTSITWSPDGTRIASASADKTVRVWQAS